MWEVKLTDRARQQYERASHALQNKLDRCFEMLAADPRNHPNIKALKGLLSGYWRYRVGDHRVVYRIDSDDRIVIVLIIAHRKDAYD
jgi:mRNA interferase RelE/StbE